MTNAHAYNQQIKVNAKKSQLILKLMLTTEQNK